MEQRADVSAARVFFALALVAVIGIPLVGFLWATVNAALAGQAPLWRVAAAVPVLALLLALVARLGRQIRRWHGGAHG